MHIHTISLEGVNSYLLRNANGFYLIDSGYCTSRESLEQILAAKGVEPGNLKLILHTHGDIDHVGNSAYLSEKYGAPTALHIADRKLVEEGVLDKKQFGSWFVKLIFKLQTSKNADRWLADYVPFTPDIWLEDGMDLSAYGLDAVVYHLPGHSNGSVMFLTNEGDLFAGDTLMNAGRKMLLAGFANDFELLEETLDKLLRLDAQMVYPGHVKPFSWESFIRKNQ